MKEKDRPLTVDELLLKSYNENGNTIMEVNRYKKLKSKLGKHTKRLLKKNLKEENDCYVIERVK